MKKKEAPPEVQTAKEDIRKEDVQCIVAREEIFPPGFLVVKEGARKRVHHLTEVLRYWLAYREVTGLEAFRSEKDKRKVVYEWVGDETDTDPRQIYQEVATVYSPDDSPQVTFQRHLQEFEKVYRQREAFC